MPQSILCSCSLYSSVCCHSVVVLDPVLTDAVSRKGEPSPTQLSWHQVITRVLEEMRPGYSIQRDNEPPVYKSVFILHMYLSDIVTHNLPCTLLHLLGELSLSQFDSPL